MESSIQKGWQQDPGRYPGRDAGVTTWLTKHRHYYQSGVAGPASAAERRKAQQLQQCRAWVRRAWTSASRSGCQGAGTSGLGFRRQRTVWTGSTGLLPVPLPPASFMVCLCIARARISDAALSSVDRCLLADRHFQTCRSSSAVSHSSSEIVPISRNIVATGERRPLHCMLDLFGILVPGTRELVLCSRCSS